MKCFRKKEYGQLGLTALAAAGLFCLVYLWKELFPLGGGSIMITDLYSQYTPLLYRFYDVVTGTKDLFMDLSVSGGANLYVDTINEVINPFNYVLLLFGRDRLYLAINVLLLLYVTAAAVSANYFLLVCWPKRPKWNVILSICYGLSGYAAYNFQIIKWMYFPVLFPLFLLALRRLLLDKKGGLYGLLLGYQLMLSVQLGFMTLLFTLFACGIWFWTGRTGDRYAVDDKKQRRADMARLGFSTLWGVLFSGAVLLPAVLILLTSSRAGENLSYFSVMKQHGLDDLFERLFQIAHPVLLGMFVWLAAERILQARKSKKGGSFWRSLLPRDKRGRFWLLLTVFLWVTVLFQPANLLWHMGSYVCFPVRYGYMVLLSGIGLLKWMLEERQALYADTMASETDRIRRQESGIEQPVQTSGSADQKSKQLQRACSCLPVALVILLPIAAVFLTLYWEEGIVQAFSSLAISLTCPAQTLQVTLILLLFCVAALCAMVLEKRQEKRTAEKKREKPFTGKSSSLQLAWIAGCCSICLQVFFFLYPSYGVRLSNEEAYRIMTGQAKETGTEAAELLREKDDPALPLNAALVNHRGSLTGYFPTASRQFKQTMEELGYLVPWVATQSVGGTAVSDGLLRMPLLLEKTPQELQLKGATALERQEELTVLTAGRSLLERFAGEKLLHEDGSLYLMAEEPQTLYLDLGMPARRYQILVNGKRIEIPEEFSDYSPNRLVELGTFTEEEVRIQVTDQSGNPLEAAGMELGALDQERWQRFLTHAAENGEKGRTEGARKLTASQFQVKRGKLIVSADSAKAGQTLLLPFAALEGWHCVQNGAAVDITPVLGGFMGITMAEGSNEITCFFEPPGLAAGLILTLLGLAGMAGSCFMKKKRTAEGFLAQGMAGLYQLLLGAAVIGIYLLPAIGLLVYLAVKVLGIGG